MIQKKNKFIQDNWMNKSHLSRTNLVMIELTMKESQIRKKMKFNYDLQKNKKWKTNNRKKSRRSMNFKKKRSC